MTKNKKTLPLFVLFVAMICFSCGSNREKNTPGSDTTTAYEGTIMGKGEIRMTLTKNANTLTGTCTYRQPKKQLKLVGSIEKNGSLLMDAFSDRGIIAGVFQGTLKNDSISGKWASSDGSQSLPFSASKSIDSDEEDNRDSVN